MKYGYCRISRATQNIERQTRNIKDLYPDAVIVQEVFTGTQTDRPEWNKLYNKVCSGDVIVFDSVSRMSRNADEGFALYQELYNKGIELIFIKEPQINTSTYKKAIQSNIQLTGTKVDIILKAIDEFTMELAKEQIKLAFDQAEKEVRDLHQRTREGIETARLNGKQIGQKPGATLTVKKKEPMKAEIIRLSKDFQGTNTDKEVMQLTGLARNTYYKYKRELKGAN